MTNETKRNLYAAGACAVFAGLALLRPDLVSGAWRATLASLSAGGLSAAKVIFEIALLGGILALTLNVLRLDGDPLTDAVTAAAAAALGFLAEYAGTQLDLWTYYTGEKPPLWIVPAWPLGALLVGRLADRIRVRYNLPAAADALFLYRFWCFLFFCVFTPFLAPGLPPAALLAALAAAGVLLYFGRAEDRAADAAVLYTGLCCVFFADLWGVTNNCWVYHTGRSAAGAASGILFGMFFDTLLVLAALRAARLLRRSVS